MKKFRVTFYTNVVISDGGNSEQIEFKDIYTDETGEKTIEEVGLNVTNALVEHAFVKLENSNDFIRSSSIVNFYVKELEEK